MSRSSHRASRKRLHVAQVVGKVLGETELALSGELSWALVGECSRLVSGMEECGPDNAGSSLQSAGALAGAGGMWGCFLAVQQV